MAICAFAIISDKDKILLVRIAPPFAESYKWNFPGGVIEDGEDIQVGLVREVFEETGVNCSIEAHRDVFTTENPPNEINIFDAIHKSGDIAIQQEEILEARWCTIDEALEMTLAFNIRDYIDSMKSATT